MDLYIDLSLLLLILLSISILTSIKILTFTSFSLILQILFIMMHGLYILFIYINPFLAHIIFIVFNTFFIYLMSKNNRIGNIFLYFFFYYGMSIILSSFNNGIVFINNVLLITSPKGILLSLLIPFFGIMMIISSRIIDKTFHLYNYKTKVYLTINKKEKIYTSYFDTGNTLKYNNTPVIFLSNSNYQIDKEQFNKLIKIKTVSGFESIYITEGLIRKKDSDENYFVYVALQKDNSKFSGCDILLNAYLF